MVSPYFCFNHPYDDSQLAPCHRGNISSTAFRAPTKAPKSHQPGRFGTRFPMGFLTSKKPVVDMDVQKIYIQKLQYIYIYTNIYIYAYLLHTCGNEWSIYYICICLIGNRFPLPISSPHPERIHGP